MLSKPGLFISRSARAHAAPGDQPHAHN